MCSSDLPARTHQLSNRCGTDRQAKKRRYLLVSERLPRSHAKSAWLADVEAEPRPTATLAVKRKQRVLIKQVVDIGRKRQSIIQFNPGAEIDQLVIRQLQIDRGRRTRRGAAEGQTVDEGARVVFLIGGLRVSRSDMLERTGHEGCGRISQLPLVAAVCRKLEFRHRGEAIAIADPRGGRERTGQRAVEFRLDVAAGQVDVQPRRSDRTCVR